MGHYQLEMMMMLLSLLTRKVMMAFNQDFKDILSENKMDTIYGLKIDVEGHEDLALAPFLMSAKLAELPTKIVIEHINQEDYPACKDAFSKLGYKLVGRSKNNSFYELSKNPDR